MRDENDDYCKEIPVADVSAHRQYRDAVALIGEIGALRQEISHLKYLLESCLIRGQFADGENDSSFFDIAFVEDVRRAIAGDIYAR